MLSGGRVKKTRRVRTVPQEFLVTDGPGNKQEKFKKTRIYKIDLTCCFTLEDLEPYLARNMFSNLPCPYDNCPRRNGKKKTYKRQHGKSP